MESVIGGTYVVGDIHGCYDEWIELKNRIEKIDKDARFILVGDIVDRGKQIIKMVDWAINNITPNGKYQMIMGNHEFMKIIWMSNCENYCKSHNVELSKLRLGDWYPSEQYDIDEVYFRAGYNLEDLKKITEWFKTLPYYKQLEVNDRKFIIAHANIPYSAIDYEDGEKIKSKLTAFDIEYIVWDRTLGDFDKLKDTTLIHGHTPTLDYDHFPVGMDVTEKDLGKACYMVNRINIDCGLVFGVLYQNRWPDGNLLALRLDDMKEFYLFDK